MLAALGCLFVMTGITVWVLWIVKNNPNLAFTLGLAVMGIIVLVITGLMWLLGVRRDTEINLKDGTVKTSDSTVARAAVTPTEPPLDPENPIKVEVTNSPDQAVPVDTNASTEPPDIKGEN